MKESKKCMKKLSSTHGRHKKYNLVMKKVQIRGERRKKKSWATVMKRDNLLTV